MRLLVFLLVFPSAAYSAGLALNEDNSHFYGSRGGREMTLEGLQAWVDQYAGTKVSHLFLCPNSMKASYGSAVWDPIWDLGRQQPPDEPFAKAWMENAKLLNDRGLDPYAVWISRCRVKNLSPWLSVRMNDVHNVDNPGSYIHSRFWVDHPEYRRVPESSGAWVDRAFDYGIPEVRRHHMRLIEELLERYDADGLELDWMRFGWHFKPGEEAQGRAILTQFTRDVRALTQIWARKRGHVIKLGARVPTLPESAHGLGMDAVAWAQEGLVDMLVATPFWATAEFDIPIERWREQLGAAGSKVVLAAGMEILLRAYPAGPAIESDIESVRGFAAAHLHRGADQIYLFNYMDPAPMRGGTEAYRTLLEQGLDLETVSKLPRKHVVTYRDTVASGMSNDAVLPVQGGGPAVFKIYTGPKPASGTATLVLGLSDKEEISAAAFGVTANGAKAEVARALPGPGELPGAASVAAFTWPSSVLVPGYNQFEVAQSGPGHEIVWAEVRIQP